ncbi:TetR/AcrR family transcriptional regulator [Paracoccus benzoatiresistens]|uniref:TetR/AcrR family transcriptional regulator n=1 Tax=Paracoccus benzoatiresistens TaxID=2997341 RepID=A0ABT4J099_9RHOB|nr:TetR/AcrR family transcriptional regulator [Paracoccus sp. EF6]MCZ0960050.1 TetR/AcrR family transcriptional regulator [Paracoccus sp. EF6]
MAGKSTLRDRRRLQTSREIQRAALTLSLRHGHDLVTTEMIAAEAGISQRTFFNYYLNRDTAIVGQAPCFDEETVAWFRASSGPLLADLLQALRQLLNNSDLDRGTSQLIDRLLGTAPELLPIFYGSLRRLRDQIADLAVTRVGEDARSDAELLAEAISHALGDTFRIWANDDAMSADSIVDVAAAKLQVLRGYLAQV